MALLARHWPRELGDDRMTFGPLQPGRTLPMLVTPNTPAVSLSSWLTQHSEEVIRALSSVGGILFRGFRVRTPDAFGDACRAFGHELLRYTERTSARVEVRPNVYTSTEHPRSQYIQFHNANSYSYRWPTLIWFGSIIAATEGGHTPLADCRDVLATVDRDVVEEFRVRKVMYIRNFREHVGLPWQVVFQTTDQQRVREYCRDADISIDVFTSDHLRIRQVRSAVAVHPSTQEEVWFNQAHLFHSSGLDPDVERVLLQTYAPEDLPRHALFGDGGELDRSALTQIAQCYRDLETSFPWEVGDFLALDNMVVAHARTPFEGERLTLVAFADLYRPA